MSEWNEPISFQPGIDEEASQLLPTFMDGKNPADMSQNSGDDSGPSDEDEAEILHISNSSSRSIFQVMRELSLRLVIAIIPSPIHRYISFDKPKARKSQLAYLDGLRGIAAFIVYIDHFSAPHFKGMLDSYGSTPSDTSMLQLPIIRLLYTGGPMVCIFFVISGTVLSLKPLTLLNAQHWMDVYQTLTSSIFRRLIRLYLPTTIATFLVMVMVQLKINFTYPLPHNPDLFRSHPTKFSLFGQIGDWITYLFTRLYYPDNWFRHHRSRTEADYAPQLWTIEIEFYSSMVLFVVLTGLVRTRATIRRFIIAILISYCFYIDRWDIALFLNGNLIADSILYGSSCQENVRDDWATRSNDILDLPKHLKSKNIQYYLHQASWFLLLFVALVIMSYTSIHGTSTMFAPLEAISHPRWTWEAIGSALLVFSITKITILRSLLQLSVPQYLGKISYAIYIVHFPMLSAGGWSLLPWVWSKTGSEGWRSIVGYIISFFLFTPIVIWVSDLWMRIVDDSCVRLGRWVEKSVMVEEDID